MSEHYWLAPEQLNKVTGERRTLVRKTGVVGGMVTECWVADEVKVEAIETPEVAESEPDELD